ncbi:MAG: hypothetical protein K2O23_01935, partial [Anaeroplasmataceae bacterium]|nr:hypothetical protein [Anaeroplasmataceae bacterium]
IYHILWNTSRIKNLFKEQLPHWHLDRYASSNLKYKTLEEAVNQMNQEIDYLDHSFSIPNNSFKENQEEKEND